MKRQFRVEELAKKRKITQEELTSQVRQLGVEVSLATIQGIWQNRPRRYRGDTLIAIARVLGVTVEELYTEENTLSLGQVAESTLVLTEA